MNNNPLFDSVKSFMNPESMFGFLKQSPVVDFSSFTGIVKQNSEALTAANQIAAESAQSIIKRCAEIYQDGASHMFNTIKDMSSSSDLEQANAHHQNYLKSSVEKAINNTKELLDMASKSSMEIFDVVGKGMSDNVHKTFNKKDKS